MLLVLMYFVVCNFAQDPAISWLAWAHASCPEGTKVTHLSAGSIIPKDPQMNGGYPALWFGIEDPNNVNLLQPIVPAWNQCSEANKYCVFNEQFR